MKVNEEIKPTNASRQIERQGQGFTPGPWEVTPTYWAKSPWEPEGAPRQIHSYNVRSTRPYDGETPTFYVNDITHKPNALLVAAAPALYEALTELLKTETNLGGVSAVTLLDAVDKAKAAIALVDTPTTEEAQP